MDPTTCPLCKSPVRIAYREDGAADHYEPLSKEDMEGSAPTCPPVLYDWLKAKRKGKKTVAIVGAGYSSCAWAPYGEPGVDVWCCNELHGKPWIKMDGITAWFQLHPKWSFSKPHKYDHYGWLQKDHPFPVYQQKLYDDIPSGKVFPLRNIQLALLGDIYRGEQPIEKVFTSTVSYQVALALYQGYKRIELYGIELTIGAEWDYQREAMTFWVGQAGGRGVEVWMPETCSLLLAPLYAYEVIRKADTGEIMLPEKDIVEWEELHQYPE